jgi:hypothetical protein
MLHEFISSKRVDIIARTKAKVKARKSPSVTEAELTQGIPLFFDQLIEILKGPKRHSDELNAAATQHGEDLLRLGFTIGQVVHDYGDVCQAVTELALDLNAKITVDEFHTLNSCLDDAIAQAVTEYSRLSEESLVDQGAGHVVALGQQISNHLDTVTTSFGILKRGTVTMGGTTGAVLERSLTALKELVARLPK